MTEKLCLHSFCVCLDVSRVEEVATCLLRLRDRTGNDLTGCCVTVQVSASSQTVLGVPHLSQPTDIERFLSLTTPTLPGKIGGVPTLVRPFCDSIFTGTRSYTGVCCHSCLGMCFLTCSALLWVSRI